MSLTASGKMVQAHCSRRALSMLVPVPAQELNLFCTLCTSLFALGCLVLSIINGSFTAARRVSMRSCLTG